MVRALIFILLSVNCFAEKMYTRTYSLEVASYLAQDDIHIDDRNVNFPKAKFIKEMAVFSVTFPEGSSLVVDRTKKALNITNTITNHYLLTNLMGRALDLGDTTRLKSRIQLIEVIDNSELLKLKPSELNAEKIKAIPKENRRTLEKIDLVCTIGDEKISVSKVNDVDMIYFLDWQCRAVVIGLHWQYKPTTMHNNLTIDTLIKSGLPGGAAFQVQSSDGQKRRNIYFVYEGGLIDKDSKVVPRFLQKDIDLVKKKIDKNIKGRQWFEISATLLGLAEDSRKEPAEDSLGGSEDDFFGFKELFRKNGVDLGKDSRVKMIPTAMRIQVRAKLAKLFGGVPSWGARLIRVSLLIFNLVCFFDSSNSPLKLI